MFAIQYVGLVVDDICIPLKSVSFMSVLHIWRPLKHASRFGHIPKHIRYLLCASIEPSDDQHTETVPRKRDNEEVRSKKKKTRRKTDIKTIE